MKRPLIFVGNLPDQIGQILKKRKYLAAAIKDQATR